MKNYTPSIGTIITMIALSPILFIGVGLLLCIVSVYRLTPLGQQEKI